MSPLLFNITLDYLIDKSVTLKRIRDAGRLIAFADDLLIELDPGDVDDIGRVFKEVEGFGLEFNRKKCNYI